MMFIGRISFTFLCVAFFGKCLFAQSTIEAFYFTDTDTGTIQRSNAEGKDIKTVVKRLGAPEQIAIVPDAKMIFWVDRALSFHQRFSQLDSKLIFYRTHWLPSIPMSGTIPPHAIRSVPLKRPQEICSKGPSLSQ